MKTFSQKPADVKRGWYVVDAAQLPLGRLSTKVASLLIGKQKPQFTPHVDGGDFVIVINSKQLKVTGDKEQKKVYYNHSGYQSGLRERRLEEVMEKSPNEVVYRAVRGMLPRNKLQASRLMRLKIYEDAAHGHDAQQPKAINLVGKGL